MTESSFELALEALLDDGHEVHFKKTDGKIVMKLNHEEGVATSELTLQGMGQTMVRAAITFGFGRIDGGD